jgi:2-polyprenyl-6-methoxyphenol hydroxylase-like FAD-dependent oxidoreductase
MKVDVVVVGARCAGASTAMLLARAGARVLVVDRGAYGTDTLSTHALMRGAVLQLQRWGVLPSVVAAGTPPVTCTTFDYEHERVTLEMEAKFGVDALYAPRRVLLDGLLSAAATEHGADVAYGVRVDDVIRDASGRVRGITVNARGGRRRIMADLVVGADGLYSTVAQAVGAERVLEGRHASGSLYTYWQQLPVNGYYWLFRPGGGMAAIPTNDGATCLVVSIPSHRFRLDVRGDAASAYRRLLREVAPDIASRLEAATQMEPVRGFGGHRGFVKRGAGPGWALVGDAGYFKDPLTSHGITDALRDAELLARAAITGTSAAFEEYDRTRLDLSRRLFEVTDELAGLEGAGVASQALHREFSREMSRECRMIQGLGALPCLSQPARPLLSA